MERLYGIEHGGDRKSSSNNYNLKTQKQLADEMGISIPTLQNYKLLADMIPELDELVSTGIVNKTTALAMMRNLSDQEQKKFIDSIPTDKNIHN